MIPPHQLEGLATLKRYGTGQDSTGSLNNAMELTSTTNLNLGSTLPVSKSSSVRLSSLSPATSLTPKAFDDINLRPSNSSLSLTSLASSQDLSSLTAAANNPELRKMWQGVLRECHRADPQRSGQINRIAFINALEHANLSNVSYSALCFALYSHPLNITFPLLQTMTPEAMNKLADNHTMSSGLVNYLLLFRNYLHGLGGGRNTASTTSLASSLDMTDSTNNIPTLALTKAHDSGPIHPWEFGYKRERKSEHPYWQQATAVPKEHEANQTLLALSIMKPSHFGTVTDKEMESFNPKEKELLLSQYPEAVIELCNKIYKLMARNWREIRSKLKKQQINSERGNILATNFITILEQHGINLTKKELGVIVKAFRVNSTAQDMVKFDDFMRVCLITKN